MACEKVAGVCSCENCECEGCECKNSSIEAVTKGIEEKCCVSVSLSVEGGVSVVEVKKELSPEIEAKLDTLLSIGEECITRDELAALLEKKPEFIAYDGFEPSGRMHIAQVRIRIFFLYVYIYIFH